MSAIYGTCHPHPAIVQERMAAIGASLKTLPHDRHLHIVQETMGLGCLLRYNTPESLAEHFPQNLPHEKILMSVTGRLDNREELLSDLDLRGHLPDGELMKQGYLRWGKEVVKRLRGDWAFAVFHTDSGELFLARDKHGYTSLCYALTPEGITFSSSPLGIFAIPGFQKRVNRESFIARLLLIRSPQAALSLYEDLHILPPAHTLTWRAGKWETERYWFPEDVPEKKYTHHGDYAEELRHLLTNAVRVRLRSHQPVACTLSGGLDSGTVAILAADLLRSQGSALHTFSHVPHFKAALAQEKPDRYLKDESPHIEAIVQASGNIQPHFHDSLQVSPLQGVRNNIQNLHQISHAAFNAFWTGDLPVQAVQAGFGTLLTGEMGNATLSFSGIAYHSLKGLPLREKLKHTLKKNILQHYPSFFNLRGNGHLHYINKSFLHPELLADIKPSLRREASTYYPYHSSAREGQLQLLKPGENPRCYLGGLKSLVHGIDYRDPTGDTRVIEHCLSIPNEAYFNSRHEGKQVIRQTMKGILPDKVLNSRLKGLQSADLYYRILKYRSETEDVLTSLRTSPTAQAWMNLPKLEKEWNLLLKGHKTDVMSAAHFFKGLAFSYFLLLQERET